MGSTIARVLQGLDECGMKDDARYITEKYVRKSFVDSLFITRLKNNI